MRWRRILLLSASAGSGAAAVLAYQRRHRVFVHDSVVDIQPTPSNESLGPLSDALLSSARSFALAVPLFLSQLALAFNDVRVIDGGKLAEVLVDRKPGQAVISVSNHVTTLDDPLVLAWCMPATVPLDPRNRRWGLCAHEICFKNPVISTLFTATQTYPVHRGGGVMQPAITAFGKEVALGKWIHIYPEGFCNQTTTLAPFRWGVGRLLTFAPEHLPPVVVPVYFVGMHTFMPLNEHRKIKRASPTSGNKILVKVGDPVPVSDLLAVWRSEKAAECAGGVTAPQNQPSAADRKLFATATARIQAAVQRLRDDVVPVYEEWCSPRRGRDELGVPNEAMRRGNRD